VKPDDERRLLTIKDVSIESITWTIANMLEMEVAKAI